MLVALLTVPFTSGQLGRPYGAEKHSFSLKEILKASGVWLWQEWILFVFVTAQERSTTWASPPSRAMSKQSLQSPIDVSCYPTAYFCTDMCEAPGDGPVLSIFVLYWVLKIPLRQHTPKPSTALVMHGYRHTPHCSLFLFFGVLRRADRAQKWEWQ